MKDMSNQDYIAWADHDWEQCDSPNAALIAKRLLRQRDALNKSENSDDWLCLHRCLWLASVAVRSQDYQQIVLPVYEEATYAEFRRECAYHWVSCCLNSRPAVEHYFATHEIDRESNVRRAVLRDGQLSELIVPEGQIDEIGEGYLATLINWFLRRYDLPTAISLMRFYWRAGASGLSGWTSELREQFRSPGNLLLPVMALSLLICIAWPYLRVAGSSVLDTYCRVQLSPTHVNWFMTLLVLFYPVALFLGVFSLWRHGSVWFKVLLPRMIAGIVVGYLPLLLTEEVWMMVHHMHKEEALLLVAGALGFSWYYLFIEVQNTVREKLAAAIRASRVFSMGVFESFIIGVVVQDLTTRAFLPDEIPDGLLQVSLIGSIYPKVLYVYFPLALLIGIFVQIIWEDKPITEPL